MLFDPEFVDEGCVEKRRKQYSQRRAQDSSQKSPAWAEVDDQAYNETEDGGDRCAKAHNEKNGTLLFKSQPGSGQGHGNSFPMVVAVIAEAAERIMTNGVDNGNTDVRSCQGHKIYSFP